MKGLFFLHTKKKLIALLLLFFCLPTAALANAYKGKGSKPETSYVIYMPAKLDLTKRHPWILGFSPDGNGLAALAAMKQACDQNNWILVASNNSRNGVDFQIIDPLINDTINSAVRTLPVDPARMYAGGLSGGGMSAHALMQRAPNLVKGVISNCGMINEEYQKEKGYPSGKDIVFMTNPQDFRYHEIQANCRYINGRGCHTCWIEFPGGHRWAPPQYYSQAFQWLDKQAQSRR